MLRPLRTEIPIYLAAISPKAVELAFEIGDGWLPLFWSPERARDVFPLSLARDGFDIAPCAPAVLTDDVESARMALKEYYAFYIGGMGARSKNFYNDLFARYGFEDEARVRSRSCSWTASSVRRPRRCPTGSSTRSRSIGSKERIADRLAAWRESGATSLLVSTRDVATLRAVAEANA